jgi:hypothetical protein
MRQTERQATRDGTDCVNAAAEVDHRAGHLRDAIRAAQTNHTPRRRRHAGGTSGAWETRVANDDQRIIAPAAHSHETIFMPPSCMGNRF